MDISLPLIDLIILLIGSICNKSISSLLSENPVPVKKVCIDDIFPVTVQIEEKDVYKKYGISRNEIIGAVKSVVKKR